MTKMNFISNWPSCEISMYPIELRFKHSHLLYSPTGIVEQFEPYVGEELRIWALDNGIDMGIYIIQDDGEFLESIHDFDYRKADEFPYMILWRFQTKEDALLFKLTWS